MATGADVVVEARRWLRTPFYHAGREIGQGVDCVGLLIGVANELGLIGGYDNRGYPPNVPSGICRGELEKFCDQMPFGPMAAVAGDVLLFRVGGSEQHIGIATGDGRMVHAFQSAKVVAETQLSGKWLRSCSAVYRLRGLG